MATNRVEEFKKHALRPDSLLQWYTLQESYDHANPNTYIWIDDDKEGPGGPREVIEDVKKSYNDYDKDGNVHATSKMWRDNKLGPLSQTDAMARIFSFNMLFDSEIDTPMLLQIRAQCPSARVENKKEGCPFPQNQGIVT